MCSLRFENNLLSSEDVRFASISKKTLLSKLSFAFVSLALPLLAATDIFDMLLTVCRSTWEATDIFDMLRTVCRSTWERNIFYWLSLSKKLFKGCLNDIINELYSACTLIFFGFTYQSQVLICVRLSFWIHFTPSTLSIHFKILKSEIWSLVKIEWAWIIKHSPTHYTKFVAIRKLKVSLPFLASFSKCYFICSVLTADAVHQ
jgi:hypothetical protein